MTGKCGTVASTKYISLLNNIIYQKLKEQFQLRIKFNSSPLRNLVGNQILTRTLLLFQLR